MRWPLPRDLLARSCALRVARDSDVTRSRDRSMTRGAPRCEAALALLSLRKNLKSSARAVVTVENALGRFPSAGGEVVNPA